MITKANNSLHGFFMKWCVSSLLIVCGITLAFIVLELMLFAFARYGRVGRLVEQTVSEEDKKYIRIVALGESTTAQMTGPAWPEYLEKELNKRAGKRMFRVYNLGVAGTNTSAIYNRLTTEVMALRPQMVITMMGINDIKYLALPVPHDTWKSAILERIQHTRSYKFIAILTQLIYNSQKRSLIVQALSCRGDEFGDYLWGSTYLPRYESLIQRLYPAPYNGTYRYNEADRQAEKLLVSFLAQYPLSSRAYEVIVDYFVLRNKWNEVLTWIHKFYDVAPYIRTCIMTNESMSVEDRIAMVRHVDDTHVFMDSMAGVAKKLLYDHRVDDRPYYEQIKASMGLVNTAANVNTAQMYRLTSQFLQDHHVAYIAMQYPLLSIGDIELMMPAMEHISYVSNEENFQIALKKFGFDALFVDNFAGMFGHTTPLGSQMIASSAADAVMKQLPQMHN